MELFGAENMLQNIIISIVTKSCTQYHFEVFEITSTKTGKALELKKFRNSTEPLEHWWKELNK